LASGLHLFHVVIVLDIPILLGDPTDRMGDVFSPQKRSWVMSRIRSKYTGIDVMMNSMLDSIGCAYEMYPDMLGNPDFVIRSSRIVIFCDGDFWHGYRYHEKKRMAKKFWRDKIEENMRRDVRIRRALRKSGWTVLRFWEHDIKKRSDKCVRRIAATMERRKQSL